MKVVLSPGESIQVELADTDGIFTINYGQTELTVHSDLPDTSGREGIIYAEKFGAPNPNMPEADGDNEELMDADWPKPSSLPAVDASDEPVFKMTVSRAPGAKQDAVRDFMVGRGKRYENIVVIFTGERREGWLHWRHTSMRDLVIRQVPLEEYLSDSTDNQWPQWAELVIVDLPIDVLNAPANQDRITRNFISRNIDVLQELAHLEQHDVLYFSVEG